MRYFKFNITTGFVALSIFFSACQKDFLDKHPLDTITSADFFLHTSDLQIYMNQFYNIEVFNLRRDIFLIPYMPRLGDDNNSDNSIDATHMNTTLAGTRSVDYQSGSYWNFARLRQINYFFDNYKRCQDSFDDYKQYVGEAHFFRALQYYYFLQVFGDVPWYSTTLGTTSPELFTPRDLRSTIADNIIADLDSAAMELMPVKTNGYSRINKWMALLLQSEVALYEGTWEKYHAGDPFGVSSSQSTKYLNKAIDATTAIMNSGLYSIYSTGDKQSDYGNLFRQQNYSQNSEVMFWVKFSIALGVTNGVGSYPRRLPASKSLTKGLADSYLCTDGKPVSVSPLFMGYDSLSIEAKNRDPRFKQTIATPDDVQLIDPNGTKHYYKDVYDKLNSGGDYNAGTGYINYKAYNPVAAQQSYFEETPGLIWMRYAQVLLNYAEAKAELGTLIQADIDKSIKPLRDRVGMPNLNMSSITTDPNWDFPALSPIINEIRRERRVELATEGFRWQDIARWAAADELIVGKRPKGFKVSQLPAKNRSAFPVDENGFLDPFRTAQPNGYGFVVGRDYLSPIPQHQIILNPKLTENPGWPMP